MAPMESNLAAYKFVMRTRMRSRSIAHKMLRTRSQRYSERYLSLSERALSHTERALSLSERALSLFILCHVDVF